eukprot:CAMPEP_0204916370 /NCGR_PEP_ID=MMETSP1397-20131031/14195_1 /ASSEMBLY_ACC=CAM_ASM_000891 /TAXON_ID=49980 /ORGANISM="Climacostomum Climacostomum virens, Strain Stock W-24" /LENGTH=190 /DNA_ID=CAMNT_0052088835 /DNA_START=227 /DNA_END=795 /DNA_ORIENTATION=-
MELLQTLAYRDHGANKTEICVTAASLIVGLVLICVVGTSEGDCDYPVRLWLNVYLGVGIAFSVVHAIMLSIAHRSRDDYGCLQKVGIAILTLKCGTALYSIVWLVLGSVWLFSSDGCDSDWIEGAVITQIILAFEYIEKAKMCYFWSRLCYRAYCSAKTAMQEKHNQRAQQMFKGLELKANDKEARAFEG